MLTQPAMSSQTDKPPDQSTAQTSIGIELGKLREHFSPTMFTASSSSSIASGDTLVDRRSPLPLDNAFVQQTKDQIRSIVETIALLANSPIEPNRFIEEALPKIVQAMGAKSAALWQQMPGAQWRMLGGFQTPEVLIAPTKPSLSNTSSDPVQSSFDRLDFMESQLKASEHPEQDDLPQTSSRQSDTDQDDPTKPSEAHEAILNAVAREKQPILIPPGNVSLHRDRPTNPTQDLLIYAPLPIAREQGEYWLLVVQEPSGGPSSQRGYLRFVAQMADLIADHFRSYRLRVFERDRSYLALAEHTMTDLSSGMPPQLGLAKLMNILRDHAQAEHVFLLRRESQLGRWKVIAAAGLTDIDRRASGIDQIERAAGYYQSHFPRGGCFRSEHMTESVDQRDPDLTTLLHTFAISESMWSKPLQIEAGKSTPRTKQDVAVLVTWSGLAQPPARCLEQTTLITRLGLSALQLPWWKSALYANKNFKPSLMAQVSPSGWSKTARWGLSLCLLCLLLLIPVPIHLNATAILLPTVQQHVYSPMDSIVEKVLVEHGQSVSAGQPLIQLASPVLTAEYDQAVAEQLRNTQRMNDIESKLLRETSLTAAQRDELEGELDAIKAIQDVAAIKLARLRYQLNSMLVVAEFDGVVSTWNIQDNLRDRPLRTGQWLLSLHEPGSGWAFEASLPEGNAQEFRQAMLRTGQLPTATFTSTPQKPIHVKYLPDTFLRMESRGYAANPVLIRESVLRVRFAIEPTELQDFEAVAGSTARISIPNGRGPLAWALSKDFVQSAWAKLRMWI